MTSTLLTIALPSCVVVLMLAASGMSMLVIGRPLMWSLPNSTLSEAIVLRDQGDMARQIQNGADPNARYDVVDVIRRGQRDRLTPLEAAVATREVYMVEVVLGYGAVVDQRNAQTLYCLARAVDADETAAYLRRMVAVTDACEDVALPYR